MQRTIKSDMVRWNLVLILLVTVCISGLHLHQIYLYTVRQNREEIVTMSEQAGNSLNHMLNQLDVLQYQVIESLTQWPEYDKGNSQWTRESLAFLKNTEKQFQAFRRAVPFVADIYWLDDYGKLYTTDSSVRRELLRENQSLYDMGEDDCFVLPFCPSYQMEGKEIVVFSYLKNIYRMDRSRGRRGILQIDMRASYLEELLRPINDNPYCLAYLGTEDGGTVWIPEELYEEGRREGELFDRLLSGKGLSGYSLCCVLDNGWRLHVVYSNDFVFKSLMDNLTSLVLLLLVMLPLSVLCVYKYSGYLTGPLQKLTGRMKGLESGELVEIHTISRFEEIRILERRM